MATTTDTAITEALERGGTIDITTTGRKTGRARRIEIWFSNVDGRLYITGMPGRRGWYANLLADPRFTVHLKQRVSADLPAKARPIRDLEERERIFRGIFTGWRWDQTKIERLLPRWMQESPLIEFQIDR